MGNTGLVFLWYQVNICSNAQHYKLTSVHLRSLISCLVLAPPTDNLSHQSGHQSNLSFTVWAFKEFFLFFKKPRIVSLSHCMILSSQRAKSSNRQAKKLCPAGLPHICSSGENQISFKAAPVLESNLNQSFLEINCPRGEPRSLVQCRGLNRASPASAHGVRVLRQSASARELIICNLRNLNATRHRGLMVHSGASVFCFIWTGFCFVGTIT